MTIHPLVFGVVGWNCCLLLRGAEKWNRCQSRRDVGEVPPPVIGAASGRRSQEIAQRTGINAPGPLGGLHGVAHPLCAKYRTREQPSGPVWVGSGPGREYIQYEYDTKLTK